MALSEDEQREALELLRWLASPETGELRKLFSSRSPYRDDDKRFETIAGFELNHDAASNAADIVEEGAKLGIQADIDRVRRLASRQGPGATQWWDGKPADYWVERARRVLKQVTGEDVTDAKAKAKK